MNLQPLFESQKMLDALIVEQHGLEGQDLLPEKILALQVELGELANEWRGFKFWREDREPWGEMECGHCTNGYSHKNLGDGDVWIETCKTCDGRGTHNPMLEEYVDCLHFILSIGNDIYAANIKPTKLISFSANITGQFNALFHLISHCDTVTLLIDDGAYRVIFNNFLHLGEMLGFTWQQIEEAYYAKNKINHTRQATGY
ncbi:hypothetical protein NCCP2716_27540 [Sporosarcina sp. NCCP-2716]|uniref:dUTP diphosphatase n=1 Tax=Sporosarcina sp. NCCP-2716 TaxID=2943679 RepID=UPI0020417F6C|nr:dUTP diphosphatase [Sporosarcina sp. NCCP-2716]GKV70256.1 hypothetical protein NCCP2716_27540 [Sporosarcina sp. NCCP-2716]